MTSKWLFVGLVLMCASANSADWTEKIQMKGDFRLRHDMVTDETAGQEDERHRQRIRLRMGLTAQVNEETKIITRVATGTATAGADGAGSTNSSFDNYDTKKEFVLDQAYFDWSAKEDLKVLGGKMPTPYYLVGGSDLYFDSDLTQEGLATQYTAERNKMNYLLNVGYNWLDERYATPGPHSDIIMLGAQAGAKYSQDNYSVLFAVAQYTYSNIKDATAVAPEGNSVTGGRYDNDYNVMVYSLEYACKGKDKPVVVYAEMIQNTEADDEDNGLILGWKYGKLKEIGDWSMAIDYRELEADATLGILSDSDIADGDTDMEGWRLGLSYQPGNQFATNLTHMVAENTVSATAQDYSRTQVDLVFTW